MSDDLEEAPCPLGCPPGDEFVLRARDRLHSLPGTFEVVRCRGCGHMRTSPRPKASIIGNYYPSDYSPFLTTRVGLETPTKFAGNVGRARRLMRRLVDVRAESVPVLPKGHLLEVGCASGSFLHRMANAGWTVEGIEFSKDAAEAAMSLGHRVHIGSVESAPPLLRPPQLIVGWMVLEHLYDPVQTLRLLFERAAPSAWLAISVPDCSNWEFRVFGSRWYALQLPTHLQHFTPASLRRTVEMAGWSVESTFHQRSLANAVASLSYVAQDAKFPSVAAMLQQFSGGRLAYLLHPLASALAAVGQTGRMVLWARKKD